MYILIGLELLMYLVVGIMLVVIGANHHGRKEGMFMALALAWFIMVPAVMLEIGVLQ